MNTKASKQVHNLDLRIQLALIIGTVALWFFYSWLRPDMLAGGGYLLRDFSQYIYTIEILTNGGILFQDVMWQYGPLPIYYSAAWSFVFGNSPLTYMSSMSLVAGINLAIIYRLLRQASGLGPVIISMLILIIPWQIRQIAGGLIYFNFEFLILSLLALSWSSPFNRKRSAAIKIGLLLGTMQFVKFGGAFIVGAVILMLDLIIILISRPNIKEFQRCLVNWLVIGMGFLTVEGILVVACLTLLPYTVAWDVIWPSYILQAYHLINSSERLPSWEGFGIALGTQIPMIVCLIVSIVGFAIWMKQIIQKEKSALNGSVVFLLFFILGLFIYFKHKWLIYQYACVLAVPCASVFLAAKNHYKILVSILMLPAALTLPYKMFVQKSGTQPYIMPNGDTLWLNETETIMATKLFTYIDSMTSSHPDDQERQRSVMVIGWVGSGLFHYGNLKSRTRHTLYLKGFMREYEEEEVFKSLDQTKYIILFGPPSFIRKLTDDPHSWNIRQWSPFSAKYDDSVGRRLQSPKVIDDHTALFYLEN